MAPSTAFLGWAVALLIGAALASRLIFFEFGKLLGSTIKSKTQQRREILYERAAAEDRGHDDGKRDAQADSFDGVIAFFHPFCNAGGGGERVLFAAILATQQRYPRALCIVFTGDTDASKEQMLANARTRFNIALEPARITFLYLATREWVLASSWPRFTLLGQSLGSLILAWDAFNLLAPDVYIDTMGYAFTLALCKWLFPKVPTGAYVHYPTISTDMLASLKDKHNSQGLNAGLGKGSTGRLKQGYWELFAKIYSAVGGSVDVVMTNSSWTQNHIQSLWGGARKKRGKQNDIAVVYPPCAVEELQQKIPVDEASESKRTRDILYIAQFRPEKMHHVIIEAFAKFVKKYNKSVGTSDKQPKPRLVLVGSVRDDQDEKRVYKLRLDAQEIKDSVQFIVNADWPRILDLLRSSTIGVNGMWNEHFGIGVVEYQAAGLISVVNNSGGPREDIVIDIDGKPTGFHATTVDEFADGFEKALALGQKSALEMRLRARKSSLRFTEEVFRKAWTTHLEKLVDLAQKSSKKKAQ